MSEKINYVAGREAEESPSLLDKSLQEHLGQKLRAAYNEVADRPAYLGDPALPPEFEHQLLRMETTIRTHVEGVEAVRDALAIPESVHEGGVEAVRSALAVPKLSPEKM